MRFFASAMPILFLWRKPGRWFCNCRFTASPFGGNRGFGLFAAALFSFGRNRILIFFPCASLLSLKKTKAQVFAIAVSLRRVLREPEPRAPLSFVGVIPPLRWQKARARRLRRCRCYPRQSAGGGHRPPPPACPAFPVGRFPLPEGLAAPPQLPRARGFAR